ncbi:nuclease [Azotobacter vinelandii CA]|uniref:Staphylococcus nuclease (SNase-like) n=2 Tax=Azotobacter vinelandii TaxID=354 RepID=C1DMI2_AZOVD|nr:thermonuclease family protein [Azotobacter vinelandii]ACO81259.1 Staphylococcus nuclease (SNase-like) [Azotobacter vinelandii DJ]AGK14119.1 nuclease [Azotobacter vinelandii CA]AGK22433.1 nuclease [Azotobacter vinelandii CA6]WKN21996.1 thermonuclease family protein [Azotobacter vinelandii]SFX28239.1 Endonuclease YncB, thermonuclease family [Azotobacter vinelandii]
MRFKLFAASLLPVVTTFASADNTSCKKVVDVTDGSSFSCLADTRKLVGVKLAKIETPTSRQPYGSASRKALSDLVLGKRVVVQVQATDQYDRLVGRVYVENIDVNARMVSSGAAWTSRLYNLDEGLLNLENRARKAKQGLWALPESERSPPWKWNKTAQNKIREKEEPFARTPSMLILPRVNRSI